jgi:hypothetical protein
MLRFNYSKTANGINNFTMRYAVSKTKDFPETGTVVIRDFASEPPGRILCVITRENIYEAEQTAQYMCDLLNKDQAVSQKH